MFMGVEGKMAGLLFTLADDPTTDARFLPAVPSQFRARIAIIAPFVNCAFRLGAAAAAG
jgi:hypothetical protein